MAISHSRRSILAGLGLGGFSALVLSGRAGLRWQAAAAPVPTDAVPFARFLPTGYRAGADDAASAFEQAVAWSSENGRAVIVSGKHRLHRGVAVDRAGATLWFDNATVEISADAPSRKTGIGNVYPIAFHVSADRCTLGGAATVAGTAPLGKSFLQGIYVDQVQSPVIGDFLFRNMAIGIHLMCCDHARCGDIGAEDMWGLQGSPDHPVGAGTAQVVSGCRWSHFGTLRSVRNDKPGRYLSAGLLREGGHRDNLGNRFGFVEVDGRPGSIWAHAMGVRSSVNSQFAGGTGKGLSYLLLCEKYTGDGPYHIEGNDFGDWSGQIEDTAASVDAAIYMNAEPDAGEIGSNRVGTVRATCLQDNTLGRMKRSGGLPQTFGVYLSSGTLEIGEAEFTGFTFHVQGMDAHLTIGALRSHNPGYAIMRYGRGLDARLKRIEVFGDVGGPVTSPALIQSIDVGRGRVEPRISIDALDCSAIGAAPRFEYFSRDDQRGRRAVTVRSFAGRRCPRSQKWENGTAVSL